MSDLIERDEMVGRLRKVFPNLSWHNLDKLRSIVDAYGMTIFNEQNTDLVVGALYTIAYDDMSYGICVNIKCAWNGERFVRDSDGVTMCGVYAYNRNSEEAEQALAERNSIENIKNT